MVGSRLGGGGSLSHEPLSFLATSAGVCPSFCTACRRMGCAALGTADSHSLTCSPRSTGSQYCAERNFLNCSRSPSRSFNR